MLHVLIIQFSLKFENWPFVYFSQLIKGHTAYSANQKCKANIFLYRKENKRVYNHSIKF